MIVDNRFGKERQLAVERQGARLGGGRFALTVAAGGTAQTEITLTLPPDLAPGLHAMTLRVTENGVVDGADAFCVVEVK